MGPILLGTLVGVLAGQRLASSVNNGGGGSSGGGGGGVFASTNSNVGASGAP